MNTEQLNNLIAQLRTLQSKAQQAPWTCAANAPNGMTSICYHDGRGWREVAVSSGDGTQAEREANASLIAEAHNALPILMGAIEHLLTQSDEHLKDKIALAHAVERHAQETASAKTEAE